MSVDCASYVQVGDGTAAHTDANLKETELHAASGLQPDCRNHGELRHQPDAECESTPDYVSSIPWNRALPCRGDTMGSPL